MTPKAQDHKDSPVAYIPKDALLDWLHQTETKAKQILVLDNPSVMAARAAVLSTLKNIIIHIESL